MRKRTILLLLTSALLFSGCRTVSPSSVSNEISESSNSIFEPVSPDLIFSELYVETTRSNRAVEIANIGEEVLDLSKYKIDVYRDGGGDKAKPSESISLNGTLAPLETYIIVYKSAKQELKNKANLITEDFLNDGTFPMTITDLNGNIIDNLGYPGYFYDLADGCDAVRKKEKLSPSEYNPYDWIRYPMLCLDNLGNLDCLDNKTIYDGPKLTSHDFNISYTNDGVNGNGGAIEVSLLYTIDGDTTRFSFPSSLSQYGLNGSNPVRYYGINTPEVAHGDNPADPYGPEAREFTNSLINKAKHFVIQSVKGYSLTETYGRMLGYVWISNVDNPRPEDYILLNHYILLNGYARVGHITRGGYNDYMLYNGISYVEYLFDAQQYAIANKLHIYEEGL